MKVGMRKPSLKKSFKARTTGKVKRQIKRSINPMYGKKGMGWINNPKKAAYNKIYNKTTFGVNDIVRATSSNSKSNNRKAYNYNESNNISNKSNYNEINKKVKELKNTLGVNIKLSKKPAICIILAWIFIIFSPNPLFLIISMILAIYALIKVCKKEYWINYRWDRAIYMCARGDYLKCKKFLDKLPSEEKEKECYKKILSIINGESICQEQSNDLENNYINTEDNLNDEYLNESLEDDSDLDLFIEKRILAKNEKIIYSNGVYNEFIVIDTETIGLDCVYDKIIEISALKYKNGKIVERFEQLINPEILIPDYITGINNISNEMVKDKPRINEVLPELLDFIEDMPLVAHNAKFDIRFLNANLVNMDKKINNKIIDTLTISRLIHKDIENHKLETIKNYYALDIDSHRASSDCIVSGMIYLEYCEIINKSNKFSNKEEEEVYYTIKEILEKNNRDTSYFKIKHTGVYSDFSVFYSFLRVKLNSKKQYILSNMDNEKVQRLGLEVEDTSKAENYKNRIKYSSINVIKTLEEYILLEFDKSLSSMEEYRKNVKSGQRNIDKYLLS